MVRPETESNDQSSNSSGWPLGLQIMSLRLRLTEMSNNNTAPPASNQPNNLFITSSSFSSFSSSNLDTESTRSFFQDNSVSFGRLIGFQAADHHIKSVPTRSSEADCGDEIVKMSSVGQQGICIPLILSTIDKINRRKDRSS
ncbi:hypothetical protein LINPERPRIM_LOCUS17560 [Linum perenne]